MEYLIDVRSPEEFSEAHYPEAINHELILLENEVFPEYSKDSTLYVYCKSGRRAELAKNLLEKNGFTEVINIGGYDPHSPIFNSK